MKILGPFIFAGAAFIAATANAATDPVTTEFSKIKAINTYAGDATVILEQNPPGCEQGFWMPQSEAEKLKVIEGAAHENSRVQIVGDRADMWKQVEERMCRLEAVTRETVTRAGSVADTDGERPVDVRKVKQEEAARLERQAEKQREDLVEELTDDSAAPPNASGTTTTTGTPPN